MIGLGFSLTQVAVRGGGAVPVYRIVGNKSGVPGGYSGTVSQSAVATGPAGFTTRSSHYTGPNGGFTKPRLIYAGSVFRNPTGETPFTSAFSKKVSIEVATVLTQAGLAGAPAATLTIAPGSLQMTDVLDIAVPASSTLFIRDFSSLVNGQRMTHSGKRGHASAPDALNVVEFPLSAGADLTASGASGSFGQKTQPLQLPTCIIGIPDDPVNHKAVLIASDSIGSGSVGSGNPTPTAQLYYGYIERQLANNVAWATASMGGTKLTDIMASSAMMVGLAQYATSVIVAEGSNDLFNDNPTLATIQSRALMVWRLFRAAGPAVFGTTVPPRVGGTYTSTGGQTPIPNSVRPIYNNWLRDGAPLQGDGSPAVTGTVGAVRAGEATHPLTAVFDPAALIEVNSANVFTLNGGYWYCGPNNDTKYVEDGTHPSTLGHVTMQPSIVRAVLR